MVLTWGQFEFIALINIRCQNLRRREIICFESL